MITTGEGASGWFVTVVFSVGIAVFCVHLWPGACYLKLTPDGMQHRWMFRDYPFAAWAAVSEFAVGRLGRGDSRVIFSTYPGITPGLKFGGVPSPGTSVLPDNFGMSAEDLATLLNTWRLRYFP